MAKAPMITRYLLGLIYFVFGLNGFLNFIPTPPPDERIVPFMTGLMSTGYFFPVLKGTEVICGLLLLSGFFAPLALIILAPITLQILLFHGVMTPTLSMQIMPIFMLILHVVSARGFWHLYQPLLKAK